jgi:hypothetical protein
VNLRPQDVVVVVKLTIGGPAGYQALASSLSMSVSEVHAAVKRATAAGLLGQGRRANRAGVIEFLVRGVKYVFVPKRGQLTRGMPTAHGAPPLDRIVGTDLEPPPVWPDPQGTVRGESFEPLYTSVPKAARNDPKLYEALCLIDAIRGGRPRDVQAAEKYLRQLLASPGARGRASDRVPETNVARRDRIKRRLAQIGPGPTSFYASALDLLDLEPPLEATSHLVGHMARDIESALTEVARSLGEQDHQILTVKHTCPTCGRTGEGDESHKSQIRAVLALLNIPTEGAVGQFWLSLTGSHNQDGLHKRAHRRDLSIPRPIDADFWERFEELLDAVLDALERRYAIVFDRVDQLAASEPTAANAKIIRARLPQNHDVANEFCRKLDDPAWIGPLEAAGIFSEPPSPVRRDEGVAYPSWPALDYLARMTSRAPTDVARVALAIPTTENHRVYEGLAEIAGMLPPALSAPFADRLEIWLADARSSRYGMLDTVAKLVDRFVEGGQPEAAIRALRAILQPSRANDQDGPADLLHEVRCQVPRPELPWLMDRLSSSASKLGRPAYDLFSELLTSAVAIARDADTQKIDTLEEWDDLSWIWRDAIEDHPRNDDDRLLSALVSAVRDGAVRLIEADPTRLSEIVDDLERRRWTVFRRLALHLLERFAAPDSDDLLSRIHDPRALDPRHTSHEYARLLRKHFGRLPEQERQKVLSALDRLDSGPLKLTWLKVIADDLPSSRKDEIDRLTETHGDQSAADELPPPPFGFVRLTSPIPHDDLVRLSAEEVIDFVTSWPPSSDFGAPQPAGLSQALGVAVEQAPQKWAAAARSLKRLDPTYLRGALRGFQGAAVAERAFDWTPVIELCVFVTAQPRDIQGRWESIMGLDTSWRGARAAAIDLLSKGLTSRGMPIPFDVDDDVWVTIEPVLDDPDEGPKQGNLYERSFNSVRANAVRAAIDYAAWIGRRHDSSELPLRVRDALDRQLARPSVVVLAALGERFRQLAALDEDWCRRQVLAIFTPGSTGSDPAWETFLAGLPDLRTFQLLRQRYAMAVADLATTDREIGERIGIHLAILYWHDQINFGDEPALLETFFDNAPSSVAASALEHVGRMLHETAPSPAVLTRLRLLWSKRVSVGPPDELAAFGWWFSSGRFDDDWALAQLGTVVEATALPVASEKVAARLAILAPQHLSRTLAILASLLKANTQGWGLFGWRGPAKSIVAAGINSPDSDHRRLAIEIAGRFCSPSYGYLEFRDLEKTGVNRALQPGEPPQS